jgi:hypothetical protein
MIGQTAAPVTGAENSPISPIVNSISYVLNQTGLTPPVDSTAKAAPQSPQTVITPDVFWKLAPLVILLLRK